MRIEEALRAHLVADAGVAAIAAQRVYQLTLPQRPTLPAVVFQRIATPRINDMDGPTGLAHPTFQINCHASSMAQASNLADAVRRALDGFAGIMGGVGGVVVQAVHVDGERNGWEDGAELSGVPTVEIDVEIWHAED